MTTSVEQFIAEKAPLVTLRADDALDNALTRMLANDFSQLPVVDGANRSAPLSS